MEETIDPAVQAIYESVLQHRRTAARLARSARTMLAGQARVDAARRSFEDTQHARVLHDALVDQGWDIDERGELVRIGA